MTDIPNTIHTTQSLRIATIVPIHDGLESTKMFLNSYCSAICNSSLENHSSIIVVDDGSTDGSKEWISEHYPNATILYGNGNLWWSGSVNLALNHILSMSFTHVLLFNNDNLIDVDFFNNLVNAVDEIGHDIIISSKVMNIFPKNYVVYAGVTFDRKRSRYTSNGDADRPAVVNTAGGMGVLIPLPVIRDVGLFDQLNFPQKSGDTDFCLRAESHGIFIHYCPYLKVYNDNRISGYSGNRSLKDIRNAYSFPKGYMNLRVDLKLFLKHGNCLWSIYEIAKKNIIFLSIGLFRIMKSNIKSYLLSRI